MGRTVSKGLVLVVRQVLWEVFIYLLHKKNLPWTVLPRVGDL